MMWVVDYSLLGYDSGNLWAVFCRSLLPATSGWLKQNLLGELVALYGEEVN